VGHCNARSSGWFQPAEGLSKARSLSSAATASRLAWENGVRLVRLREVLAQQPVGVLVRPSLPRASRSRARCRHRSGTEPTLGAGAHDRDREGCQLGDGRRGHTRCREAVDVGGASRVSLGAFEVARWADAGATTSVIAGRFRVPRAAIGWAYDERVIDYHPIRTMRGPQGPEPRLPSDPADIGRLLAVAEERMIEAFANHDGSVSSGRFLHATEQDLLLVRLAADSGARRGELAGLRFSDLSGHVLNITRAVSAREIGPPKSGRPRPLTLGASTVRLWHSLQDQWQERRPEGQVLGPWVFAVDSAHDRRLTAGVLDRRFRRSATVRGCRARPCTGCVTASPRSLSTAARSSKHKPASATRMPPPPLRIYSHALPLTDGNVADAIDRRLDQPWTGPDVPAKDPPEKPRQRLCTRRRSTDQ
jgi:integrase